MGLKIVAHPECLENLSDAKTELDERQKRDTLAKSIASEIKAGNIGLIRAMIDTIESEQ